MIDKKKECIKYISYKSIVQILSLRALRTGRQTKRNCPRGWKVKDKLGRLRVNFLHNILKKEEREERRRTKENVYRFIFVRSKKMVGENMKLLFGSLRKLL